MNAKSDPETTPLWVARSVFRHKGKACLFFLLVVASTLAWLIFCPAKFRSEGKLLVRLGRENAALDPTVTLGREQLLTVPQLRDNEINSIVEVLNSRALAEKVVDLVGVRAILDAESSDPSLKVREEKIQKTPPLESDTDAKPTWRARAIGSISSPEGSDRERAIRRVAKNLEVAPVPKSNIIRLSYQAGSPRVSQAVLGKVIELFLAEYIRLNRPEGGDRFLRDQAKRLQMDLESVENSLCRVKEETGLVSPESRREIIVKRIGRLEDDFLRAETESAATQKSICGLKQKLATLPKTEVTGETKGVGDHGTDLMRDRFYGQQVYEELASAKYSEANPKMKELRRQTEAAKTILDSQKATRTQVTVAPHKPYEQATLQLLEHELALSSQLARADSLRAQLSAARKTLSTLNIDEVRIDRLQREKEIAEAKYRKYSAVLEEARIDNALDAHCMSNISIVQAASFDPQPVQPRWPVILAGGLAAALLGAIALAVIAEYLSVPSLVPVAPPALENQSHSTPAASSNGNGNGAGNENGAALVGSTGKLRSTSAA